MIQLDALFSVAALIMRLNLVLAVVQQLHSGLQLLVDAPRTFYK